MRYLIFVVLCASLLSGCSESNPTAPTAPPAPAPLPTATIVAEPGAPVSKVDCFTITSMLCTFRASARNTGPGCAAQVSVVVTFLDSGGQIVGTPTTARPIPRTIRPNELFTYDVPRVDPDGIAFVASEFSWTNIAC